MQKFTINSKDVHTNSHRKYNSELLLIVCLNFKKKDTAKKRNNDTVVENKIKVMLLSK